MFCARAGAARVYAVDASAIIGKARENVARNGLADVITCVHGKIEDVVLPGLASSPSSSGAGAGGGGGFVDVIVSEWMGYCLLFEAMLPSVLWARDRYLRPGTGLMVPSHTSLRLAPAADPAWTAGYGRPFWADVYGFDMAAVAAGLEADACVLEWRGPEGVASADPASTSISTFSPPSPAAASPPPLESLRVFDLYAVTPADLSFTAPFRAVLDRDVDPLDGFVVWFDTFFSPRREGHEAQVAPADTPEVWAAGGTGQEDVGGGGDRVAFTTSPWAAPTHWKQGLLLCKYVVDDDDDDDDDGGDNKSSAEEEEKKKKKGSGVMKKGDEIRGDITFAVDEENYRALSIKMSWIDGGITRTQTWGLK